MFYKNEKILAPLRSDEYGDIKMLGSLRSHMYEKFTNPNSAPIR